MTHPVDRDYPYDPSLPKPPRIFALDDLKTIEDRDIAAAAYDLWQALDAKRKVKQPSRDGFVADNERPPTPVRDWVDVSEKRYP